MKRIKGYTVFCGVLFGLVVGVLITKAWIAAEVLVYGSATPNVVDTVIAVIITAFAVLFGLKLFVNYFNWLERMMQAKQDCSEKDYTPTTAKSAYENAADPQMRSYWEKINSAIKIGWERTYISDIHQSYPMRDEHIQVLCDAGFDIVSSCRYDQMMEETLWRYEAIWSKDATGKHIVKP